MQDLLDITNVYQGSYLIEGHRAKLLGVQEHKVVNCRVNLDPIQLPSVYGSVILVVLTVVVVQ